MKIAYKNTLENKDKIKVVISRSNLDIKVRPWTKLIFLLFFIFCFFGIFSFADAVVVNTTNKDTLRNGLVGHWTMDGKDVVSGVLQDKSGNGNSGRLVNIATSTFYTLGKIGQAFRFSKNLSQYVTIPDNSSFDNTSTLSFGGWFYLDSLVSFNTIICKRVGSSDNHSFCVFADSSGKLNIDIDGFGDRFTSTATLSPKKWYQFMVVYDGNLVSTERAKLYINGTLDRSATETSSSVPNYTSTLRFGELQGNSAGYMGGKIDDIRIYNRALSASEITQLYNQSAGDKINSTPKGIPASGLNSGLVGWWTMDGKDVVNGVLQDKSGNGNTGNLVNIATSTFYTLGKIGQAGKFDGSDDVIVASSDLVGTGADSICAWIKPSGWGEGGFGRLFDNSVMWFYLVQTGQSLRFTSNQSSGFYFDTTSSSIKLNQWQHVCAVRDASGSGIVYINAVSNNTGNTGTPAAGSTSYIGNRAAGDRAFNGLIDDVRIYNRVLSASEITQLYNQGAGDKVNSTPKGVATQGLNSGLVGHWTMDGKDVVNGVLQDKSGNGNSGQLVNIATSTFYTLGKIGQAFKFDGVNDYVNSNYKFNFGTSPFAVSFWINTKIAVAFRPIIGEVHNTLASWTVTFSNLTTGTLSMQIYDGSGTDTATTNGTTKINDGKWHHIVAFRNGSTLNIYVDGRLEVTPATDNQRNYGTNANFAMMARADSFLPNGGKLDDVRLYNRVLSASEITQLYNLGR